MRVSRFAHWRSGVTSDRLGATQCGNSATLVTNCKLLCKSVGSNYSLCRQKCFGNTVGPSGVPRAGKLAIKNDIGCKTGICSEFRGIAGGAQWCFSGIEFDFYCAGIKVSGAGKTILNPIASLSDVTLK